MRPVAAWASNFSLHCVFQPSASRDIHPFPNDHAELLGITTLNGLSQVPDPPCKVVLPPPAPAIQGRAQCRESFCIDRTRTAERAAFAAKLHREPSAVRRQCSESLRTSDTCHS